MSVPSVSFDFTLDALIRSMVVTNPCRHILFLGAGGSITSGMPSASDCIWQWKRDIFLSAQPGVSPLLLGDPALPHVQQRIQAWLDAAGAYPPINAENEYAFYAE